MLRRQLALSSRPAGGRCHNGSMRVGLSILIALAGLLSPFAADVATQTPEQPAQVAAQQPFEEWLGALIKEAEERGYGPVLIDQTLIGLEPLTRVVASDRSQAELTITFERYYT